MAIEIRTNTPAPEPANAKIKAEVLRSRGKNNSLHDIEQAADYLDQMAEKISKDIQAEMRSAVESIILQKHQERLAYNAAYQRDLRTIKRLGLSITVAQYRKSKET